MANLVVMLKYHSVNGTHSMSTYGNLYTISAPSGTGKTSLVKASLKRDSNLCVSVSHTTRTKRPGEQHGVDYHFVSHQKFNQLVANELMLEHANVFGNSYGTSKAWVEKTMASGKDVILEIDWQGRNQVLAKIPTAIAITILPPSKEALLHRLQGRDTDNEEVIATRMAEAEREISHFTESHYMIVNKDFEQALQDLTHIFASERLKTNKQQQNYQQLLADLLA